MRPEKGLSRTFFTEGFLMQERFTGAMASRGVVGWVESGDYQTPFKYVGEQKRGAFIREELKVMLEIHRGGRQATASVSRRIKLGPFSIERAPKGDDLEEIINTVKRSVLK